MTTFMTVTWEQETLIDSSKLSHKVPYPLRPRRSQRPKPFTTPLMRRSQTLSLSCPKSSLPSFLSLQASCQPIHQSLSKLSSRRMHSPTTHYPIHYAATTPRPHLRQLTFLIPNLLPPYPLSYTHHIAFPRQKEHSHKQRQANQTENYRHDLSRTCILPMLWKSRARRRLICLWSQSARHCDSRWRSTTDSRLRDQICHWCRCYAYCGCQRIRRFRTLGQYGICQRCAGE